MKSSIKPLAWVVAAAGALLLAGTAMAWRRPTPAAAAPPPAEVSILTVAPETVAARYEYVGQTAASRSVRSEEHTSELQSRLHLVCRLLLEKKKEKQRDRWH